MNDNGRFTLTATLYDKFGERWEEAKQAAEALKRAAAPLVSVNSMRGYEDESDLAAQTIAKAKTFLDFLDKAAALRFDPSGVPPGQQAIPFADVAPVGPEFIDDDGSGVVEVKGFLISAHLPGANEHNGAGDEAEVVEVATLGGAVHTNGHSETHD